LLPSSTLRVGETMNDRRRSGIGEVPYFWPDPVRAA